MGAEQPLFYGKKTARTWRERLEALQEGVCCICRRPPPFKDRVFDRMWAAIFTGGERLPEEYLSMLWVDHDHHTDIVRGMLCSDCNAAIMPLEDGREATGMGAEYLAVGDRLGLAREHLQHSVVKTGARTVRLVSAPHPAT